MKSFIPWVGGKSLLAKKIVSMFPDNFDRYIDGAILKKWTAKSERWYNNKKRRETHGKHQVYRGIQAKHSKLV